MSEAPGQAGSARPFDADRVPVVACTGLRKTYGEGELAVPVLHGIDLAIHAGERVAIVGASGSERAWAGPMAVCP